MNIKEYIKEFRKKLPSPYNPIIKRADFIIGEKAFITGDTSVGIPNWEGFVREVYPKGPTGERNVLVCEDKTGEILDKDGFLIDSCDEVPSHDVEPIRAFDFQNYYESGRYIDYLEDTLEDTELLKDKVKISGRIFGEKIKRFGRGIKLTVIG